MAWEHASYDLKISETGCPRTAPVDSKVAAGEDRNASISCKVLLGEGNSSKKPYNGRKRGILNFCVYVLYHPLWNVNSSSPSKGRVLISVLICTSPEAQWVSTCPTNWPHLDFCVWSSFQPLDFHLPRLFFNSQSRTLTWKTADSCLQTLHHGNQFLSWGSVTQCWCVTLATDLGEGSTVAMVKGVRSCSLGECAGLDSPWGSSSSG